MDHQSSTSLEDEATPEAGKSIFWMRFRSVLPLALTLLMGYCFLAIDNAWKGSPVTPLLSICWLMMASFHSPPRAVGLMVLILLFFVLCSLVGQGMERVVIRGATFIIGGGLAIFHAHSRKRMKAVIWRAHRIAELLPAAVVTVDSMGAILSASDEFKNLVGPGFQPIEGHCFSDILMGSVPPGEAMRLFMSWFQQEGNYDEVFQMRDRAENFLGRRTCVKVGGEQILIVTLNPNAIPTPLRGGVLS